MKRKILLFILILKAILMIITSCEGGNVKTNGEIIELKGFEAAQGKHCESTSMMNALHYQGLKISESMINGLGGNLDFTFYTDNNFPFFGVRSNELLHPFLENTGIKCVEKYPDNSQDAYDEVKDILKKGIPVVIQLDMRYLRYRWGGKYAPRTMSFGAHFVTLIKIDEKSGFVWLTETDETGVESIEKLKISDFMKARGSKGGFRLLLPKYHYYYFINPVENKIDYKECLKYSLKRVIDAYQKEDGTIEKLKRMPDEIVSIEDYINTKYILKPLFHTFYGYIEIFGSGGSAFRNFYRDYLQETAVILNDSKIDETASYVNDSAVRWRDLAYEFKRISDVIDIHYNNIEKRKIMYNKAGTLAEKVYKSELEMIEKIEELYNNL